MYFCYDIPKDDTVVKQCHLLHHKKYFCKVTTDDDTDNDTDDDN